MRPPFFHSSVTIFIRNNLLVAGDFEADNALPKGATVDEYFASIGGGDSMKVFPQVARRHEEDDDSYESDDYPPMTLVGGSARNGGGNTEDDLVQQAIALSLAEQTKPADVDDDLALALALSAAEASKDGNGSNGSNGSNGTNPGHSDLRDSNSSVGKADSRKPGARSPANDDTPVAAAPGSSKVKKDKKEKEKKSKKEKDKKSSSKDPQSSVSPATSPNPLGNPFLEEPESPVVSPRPPKDKKSKHKSPASTSSPPLSPIASPKRSNDDDRHTPRSPAKSPLSGSKLGRSDEPAVSLDLSEDDSMDEDLKLAIAMSQQPQTPPRSKKK